MSSPPSTSRFKNADLEPFSVKHSAIELPPQREPMTITSLSVLAMIAFRRLREVDAAVDEQDHREERRLIALGFPKR
jgi:hypothetical protein